MFLFTNWKIFMTQSGKPVPQLSDEKWVMAVAFSVAVTTQELNVKLHGKVSCYVKCFLMRRSLKRNCGCSANVTVNRLLQTFDLAKPFLNLPLSRWLADAEKQVRWHHSVAPKYILFKVRRISDENKWSSNVPQSFCYWHWSGPSADAKRNNLTKITHIHPHFLHRHTIFNKTHNVSESNCFRPQATNNYKKINRPKITYKSSSTIREVTTQYI